jgi:uncharacterized membrane protein
MMATAVTILLSAMHSPIAPLPGVVTMLLYPGAVVMSLSNLRPSQTSGRIVLAVCLSLMVIMIIGGVASLLGPHLGLVHPLNPMAQRIIWAAFIVVTLVASVATRNDPLTWVFEEVDTPHLAITIVCVLLLAVTSILGVAKLNGSGDNRLAVVSVVLDVTVLLVGIVGGWRRTSRWPLGSLLYAAAFALLLSTSLRGGHLYGWDIQKEFDLASHTMRAGVWSIPANHDAYSSMLSLTVLPTILHSLLKLRLVAFFELVIPAILALLPIAVFSTINSVPRWTESNRPTPRPGLALGVVTAFIVSSAVFPVELESISRQAIAITMLASLVMVVLDRTMKVRQTRIAIGLLIIAISFTHYSTSYLLAGVLLLTWISTLVWSKGWIVVSSVRVKDHRALVKSQKIVNATLVVIALVAAFGWNLGVTRNNALTDPSGALVAYGAGFESATGSSIISAPELERLLVKDFHQTAKWIVPVAGSNSIHLESASSPPSPGVASNLARWWNRLNLVAHETLWALAGVALLYGVFYLHRRQSNSYSSDLVGLAVAGLVVGAALRFSGTLATFYNPERGAIVAAILLVTPITLFLDDVSERVSRISVVTGVAAVTVFAVWASGLGALFFGGQAPGALVARGENVERFTVSTPELATAVWMRNHLSYTDLVQSDRYGQLVLLSEMVPPEVDRSAWIYLSSSNLLDDRSRAAVENGRYIGIYRSNLSFFNNNFYVVYSTGVTRVYHGN